MGGYGLEIRTFIDPNGVVKSINSWVITPGTDLRNIQKCCMVLSKEVLYNKQKSLLCDFYNSEINNEPRIIYELEEVQKQLIQRSADIKDILLYSLVLMSDCIADFDKVLELTDDFKSNYRIFLIRQYIFENIFGEESIGRTPILVDSSGADARELSAICYFQATYTACLEQKERYLMKSLEYWNYNLMSLIKLEHLNFGNSNKNKVTFGTIRSIVYKINNISHMNKELIFKVFLYSKILGVYRPLSNLNAIENMYFPR
ncbi:hypothetical protein [Saccharicrinis aurantiacus]|uniref:hypothetical protein n=1 Tax=Saccharicrinis aurantiacus TaxID=1849719 RepID=UPI00248F58FC|nr:hypothetical protein [Saccharicrinis aurantiacus]